MGEPPKIPGSPAGTGSFKGKPCVVQHLRTNLQPATTLRGINLAFVVLFRLFHCVLTPGLYSPSLFLVQCCSFCFWVCSFVRVCAFVLQFMFAHILESHTVSSSFRRVHTFAKRARLADPGVSGIRAGSPAPESGGAGLSS